MSKKFRDLIEQAAARANAQITEVYRGQYRPRIEVMTQGEPLPRPQQGPVQAVAA